MKTSGAHQTAAVEDIVQREGEGGLRLRADYRAFPSQACISQIDNVAGLRDQPGDFHMKRCFPSEIDDCYYSLTFFSLLGAHGEHQNSGNQASGMRYII